MIRATRAAKYPVSRFASPEAASDAPAIDTYRSNRF